MSRRASRHRKYTANADGIGTLRLLEAIRLLGMVDKTRIYQASTSELYGLVQEVPQSETTPIDETKIRSELSYRPTRDFPQEFAETLAWYLACEKWQQQVTTRAAKIILILKKCLSHCRDGRPSV